jgi:acetolactate synthase-1/3 small subunit
VITVTDLTKDPFLNRECLLIRVAASRKNRSEIIELADVFGGSVVAVRSDSLVIHLTAEQTEVNDFMELMKPFKVLDVSRSGIVAMDKE